MSLSAYSQFCSPFLNVRIKINFYCCADQHKYKISVVAAMYGALLLRQVATELVIFSEGCQVPSSARFTLRPTFSLPLALKGLQLKLASMNPSPQMNLLPTSSQIIQIHTFLTKRLLLSSHQCLIFFF